jgi:hypothetical protein
MIRFVGIATYLDLCRSTFAGEELSVGSNTDNFKKLSFKELLKFVARIFTEIVILRYIFLSEYHA